MAALLLAGPVLAAKTDVIYLRNGDRVTCEIKKLERGQLKVSTDGMGTVYIEWEDIAQIASGQNFVVELEDGERVEGTLAMPYDDGTLLVSRGEESRRLEMASVVWVDPLKLDQARIKRWDGSVSAGFDTTKANRDTSLSASFDARRRAQDFQLDFDGYVYSTSSDDSDASLRAAFSGLYRGLLEDRWYWAGVGSLERNDEQGIELRSLAGAGYGRFLVQTGRTLWSATAGLAVVNERRDGETSSETNIEALLNTEYEFFTYDTYDSNPPEAGEENDYGIVTSLGYSF